MLNYYKFCKVINCFVKWKVNFQNKIKIKIKFKMNDLVNDIFTWLKSNYLTIFTAIAILTIMYSLHYLIAKEGNRQTCRDWVDLGFFTVSLGYLFLDYLFNYHNFKCPYTVKYFLVIEYAHLLLFRIFYKLIVQYPILFKSWSQ